MLVSISMPARDVRFMTARRRSRPQTSTAGLGRPRAASSRSGSASSALYQIARGLADRRSDARVRERPRRHQHRGARRRPVRAHRSRTSSPASHFLDVARLVDVLELRVHRHRADAAVRLPAPRTSASTRFRNWILLANLIGLVGYVVVPTAPPRMFPTFGFPDTLAEHRRPEPRQRPRPARREPVRGDAEPARRRRADRRA